MALRANATLTFSGYEVGDGAIELRFLCADPGPGEPSEYAVSLTDAETASISTLTEFRAMALAKLNRKLRAAGVASRLDSSIGQSFTL